MEPTSAPAQPKARSPRPTSRRPPKPTSTRTRTRSRRARARSAPARTRRSTRTSPATSSRSSRRVRRLRRGVRQVPRRPDPRGRVHRLPAQAGRLRPAPAGRADDPRQAAARRRHAGSDGCLRERGREVRAAEQGPHHDPPEHPDAPRAAARRRRADPRDLRGRPLEPRGLRQHDPQRHRRSLGRRRRRRDLRPDPLRDRLRPLLRPPPDDAADAAQDQDRVLVLGRRPRDHRHPRRRLHPADPRRRQGLRDRGRRRHLDHAADRRRRSTSSSPPTTAST